MIQPTFLHHPLMRSVFRRQAQTWISCPVSKVHRPDMGKLLSTGGSAIRSYGNDGQEAVKTAFAAAEELAREGIDLDFMDLESLDRARIEADTATVSGSIARRGLHGSNWPQCLLTVSMNALPTVRRP